MGATSRFTPEAEGCFTTDAFSSKGAEGAEALVLAEGAVAAGTGEGLEAAAELVVLVLADGAAAAGTDRGGLEAMVELSGLEGAELAGVDGRGLEASAKIFAFVVTEGALAATANDESSAF